MKTFEVIYEDDGIIVCYKPAGIATQTKRLGQQDMESILKNERAKKKEIPYIGVVHRLDQPVEGIMVFAKTKKAAAELSKQVQSRSIGKKYYAAAWNIQGSQMEDVQEHDVKQPYQTLTDYMIFDSKKNLGQIVSKEVNGAKKAVLEYRVCGVRGDKVMFDISLHTGRHHQIRLQMANAGYPLVGDRKYGECGFEHQKEKVQLALCSYSLEFIHPFTGKDMVFSVKPGNAVFDDFR